MKEDGVTSDREGRVVIGHTNIKKLVTINEENEGVKAGTTLYQYADGSYAIYNFAGGSELSTATRMTPDQLRAFVTVAVQSLNDGLPLIEGVVFGGICGDEPSSTNYVSFGGTPTHCVLYFGHRSTWHEGANGTRWKYTASLHPSVEDTANWIAGMFHATYRRLAPEHGYILSVPSAIPWDNIPEDDKIKKLLVAVITDMLNRNVIAERR